MWSNINTPHDTCPTECFDHGLSQYRPVETMIGKDNLLKGKYWSKSWGLVSGCTPCSPGCTHCWALAMEKRFYGSPQERGIGGIIGPSRKTVFGNIQIHPERLDIPLKRKKPTAFSIWNDIAHESVPEKFRVRVFDIMAQCPQHIFLMLTKRIGIMSRFEGWVRRLPNVWPGVTICNQPEADEKIPILLQIPAAVRWVSIEPMLGPVDLLYPTFNRADSLSAMTGINWVILGGETGPGARPMKTEWVRDVRDKCVSAGVKFLFKAWGPRKEVGRILDGRTWDGLPT